MAEKEIQRKKEEILKLMGFPLHNMHFHDLDDRAVVFEIMNTTAKSNLIPRVMKTTIMVYPITMFNADLSMQFQNERRHSNNNSRGFFNNNARSTANNNNNNALAGVRAAIANQNQEMLKTILEAQPDLIMSTDEEGLTPLSYAASKGFDDMVLYFLENFPKTTYIRSKDKSYPIHKACLGGHVRVLEEFYSKFPTSLSSVDNNARTILHVAAKERGNKLKNVVAYLLTLREGRELINKKDENRCTPLDLARSNRNGEVEELIGRIMRH
ncbi:protein ACCELERATED CELL DEATH 6-like [Chenopodium quinoa]|uniref:protein ACCELERATED CELL DEATH 6-like n=1 Tax=Chenopodium quinoa TaxID=63459 RepID=UPI000B77B218|nr:protein ACCELERATED CELL DEATH 6-like [Chenopodium quinoa]